jgi:hypothetical protein
VVALPLAEGGEKRPQVLEAAEEDGRTAEGDEVVLALMPNEALVVDATGISFTEQVASTSSRCLSLITQPWAAHSLQRFRLVGDAYWGHLVLLVVIPQSNPAPCVTRQGESVSYISCQ